MENISYIGLSRQTTLQREMEITANNIANMDTPGFKGQGVLFLEYVNKKGGDQNGPIKQVNDYGTYRDLKTGALKQTFNKLDMALNGPGYFTVQTPQGVRYTRNGSFSVNAAREIVTKEGYQVLGDSGPLVLQADAADLTVTAQGDVSTERGGIGKLKIVDFANAQNLKPVGNTLFSSGGEAEKPVENPIVGQGLLESSNVNPIVEMNKMIQISRMYEAAQHLLIDDHKRILSVIETLSKPA